MELKELLTNIEVIKFFGLKDRVINDVTNNSSSIKLNDLFIAIDGNTVDGHMFINDAIDNGSKSVICEKIPDQIHDDVTYIIVNNTRKVYSKICSNYFKNPSKKLSLIGITGTNGKTTTATLLHKLFKLYGFKVGLLSTNKILIDGKEFKTNLTTPDSYKLNFYLSEMVNSNVEYCFMEVSSHSIDQERISNLDYDIGVYTNISHDHLNYHKTFKNYIYTKKKFFDSLSKDSYSLINIDDKNSSVMVQNTRSKIKTYSLKKLSDYNIKIIENNIEGLIIQLNNKLIHTQITGKFNAYNLVAVYAVCDILGLDQSKSIELLSKIKPVEGRFQVIANNGITGIVDFAHTPDAIEKVLVSVKDYVKGDGIIITVVGCGGGRDKEKRNKMGYVSSELSDLTIFTSDNPRNEDPNQIIEDMKMGVDNKKIKKVKTIIDRKDAIKYAVSTSKVNDILLVLGKGHEKYQIVGDKKIEFSDSEVLNNYLKIAI
tara:strand:+ start:4872 stop:6326 length:1455 start_codon:yes stop_codon:yes gene_type:complete